MKKCFFMASCFITMMLSSCEFDSNGDAHISTLGWIIIVVVVVGFIAALISGSREASNTKEEMKRKKMDLSEFIEMGTYAGGHPTMNDAVEKIYARKEEGNIHFYKIDAYGISMPQDIPNSDIPIDSITDITIEDATSIERRITVGRILLVGIFAWGWKKKKKNEMAFLIIEWKRGKFDNATTYSFEGKDAFQKANTARNKLISFCEDTQPKA